MDYGMLLRLVPTLAAVAAVSLLARRAAREREAAEGRPAAPGGELSYGLPPVFWRVMLIGLGFLAFPLMIELGSLAAGKPPFRQWEAELGFVAAAALSVLASAYYRTWRLTADAGGLRLRRLVLPSLDVPWEELDALVISNNGQTLYVMAGGRRRAGFSMACVSHGDALSALYGAARSHGALVSAERDLPEGVPGPHGARRQTLDDRVGALPVWEQLLLALAFIAAFSLATYLLVVLLMR